MDMVLRTAELHADGDREAGTVLERARVGDALVDAEAHLLRGVRVVREHLLRKHDRGRGDDLAGVEIEFDLVDLHVLPYEAEELVRIEDLLVVVEEVGFCGRARDQCQPLRGRDKAEVVRILARAGLKLEPAVGGHYVSDYRAFTVDQKIVRLTCLRTGHRRRCVPLSALRCEKRGPCR